MCKDHPSTPLVEEGDWAIQRHLVLLGSVDSQAMLDQQDQQDQQVIWANLRQHYVTPSQEVLEATPHLEAMQATLELEVRVVEQAYILQHTQEELRVMVAEREHPGRFMGQLAFNYPQPPLPVFE